MKDSGALVPILDSLVLSPTDILDTLDTVPLFTNVPLAPTLDLLKPLFSQPIADLFQYIVESTYFQFNHFNSQFYEQKEGVAMGSPLSSVIADLCMEAFEKCTL